ncbi:hypothetical protein PF010_g31368 [Phytophthora fragariae]|uniref:Uncharacterized protein n=1 Tax=Phytophthora fragariae TaxID=53985 RepID=A0A6G0JHK8_9STRA|nr:hypothetical protein PF010_g31368 [Phytophthora fragariae]KAE9163668.1 hypothetical protein PF004_g30073 [Phytophthora fragariae]
MHSAYRGSYASITADTGGDGDISTLYNKFVVLLAEVQHADSMLVALATAWRLTPPITAATQVARRTRGGDGDIST